MKFPSKVTPYGESVISKFPIVLRELQARDQTVSGLYYKVYKKIKIQDFIDTLDCLYVLGEITLNKEVIHYVKRNSI